MKSEDFLHNWLRGSYETIYYSTSKPFQDMIALDQFVELCSSFNEGVTSYEVESVTNLLGLRQHVWIDDSRERAVIAAFSSADVIESFYLKPYVTFPEQDEQWTQNQYIMPIKDEWFVFWGGTNEFVNYHYIYETQRYAFDLVKVKNGQEYHDSPTRNEHYYAFDAEVVAPADGKVVKVVDGLPDNVPGEMDADNPAGNYIVLEHANGEYSMIAHFKQHSIVVQLDDIVSQGQILGKCGNSGNSSAAHIHFQVMDSADFEQGKSIRIQFHNGKQPIQGDFV